MLFVFSPGSRFAYLGCAASEAYRTVAASRRTALTNQAAVHLQCCRTLLCPLISGRILHTKGQETYDQIAFDAAQQPQRAVNALIQLGDVANAVDIC
jgi:hypothetical protein